MVDILGGKFCGLQRAAGSFTAGSFTAGSFTVGRGASCASGHGQVEQWMTSKMPIMNERHCTASKQMLTSGA
ncbi:MAG: hypothetical protein CMM05_03520 [Rhodopirellula sp.]|nr:hypothetical protein [Rhodopirellula sp.]